jgi:hypothetical protein
MRLAKLLFTLALLLPATAWAQQGKIAGQVTDAGTGESLPGVNVAIVGTTQGAVTDAEGFYHILNVRPGTYGVRASFIGYTASVQEGIHVSTDLTSTLNFELQEGTVGLDEVVVTAEQPIVQADVSANVANLSAQDFQDLPVAGISEVLDLQAGIEPGLMIRGGGMNQVAFIVDGQQMRTGRHNDPLTSISYTSLEEVQVQTGGFSAEYGNVRSGIVNIATKEPSRTEYTVDALIRFAPAQEKTFDAYSQLPSSCDYSSSSISIECNTWFARPVLDPAVRLNGVENSDWDAYDIRQYKPFPGWGGIIDRLQSENFDVTEADMIEYWHYMWRKSNEITMPDYDADITIGGPVPGSQFLGGLGGLRFLASYRGSQTAYLYPQDRKAYTDNTFQGKLISNVAPGMKLTFSVLGTQQRGQLQSENTPGTELWTGDIPAYPWWGGGGKQVRDIDIRGDELFTDGQWPIGDIDHLMLGMQFTHTLNQNTFYEIGLQRMESNYQTHLPVLRDGSYVCPESGTGPDGARCQPHELVRLPWTDNFGRINEGLGYESLIGQENGIVCFGGKSDITGDGAATPYCSGQEPMGFAGIGGNILTDESTGGHWVKTRDTSSVTVYTGRFDLTSQFNRFLLVQTGAELIYSDYNMDYASINIALAGPQSGARYPWDGSPVQGAAYAQGKLEFQGMIANLGVRLDYFDPNTEWWQYGPYEGVFRFNKDKLDEELETESVGSQISVSPRVGISFPITSNSKLYFNYGHFRQMMDAYDVLGIRQSKAGGIDNIANPEHPLPKTVAYELGFDQNVLDQFLLRISGYYRDNKEQTRTVNLTSLGGVVNYSTKMPWAYSDVRGAEFSISKNRGTWIQGFANFTYQQSKSGNFGYSNFFENSFQMVNWLRDATDYRQTAPVAEPFARANLLVLTPQGFGPEVAGKNPLGNFRISILGDWRKGIAFTWAGGASIPEVRNNVRYRDYWNFDLRFTKHLTAGPTQLQLFADIDNVFNLRHLNWVGAWLKRQGRDSEDYLRSLHLPSDIFDQLPDGATKPYLWVPGDDRPGIFRDWDVKFQPIEAKASLPDAPDAGFERGWVWAEDTDTYHRWTGSGWENVPSGELDQVLGDKAYIDMPNHRFNTFLNPRRITLGLRVSF